MNIFRFFHASSPREPAHAGPSTLWLGFCQDPEMLARNQRFQSSIWGIFGALDKQPKEVQIESRRVNGCKNGTRVSFSIFLLHGSGL